MEKRVWGREPPHTFFSGHFHFGLLQQIHETGVFGGEVGAGAPGEFVRPGVGYSFEDIGSDFAEDRGEFEAVAAAP